MTRTSTLFATPSFFRGMSAVLDVGSTRTLYNESDTPEEADVKAMYSDWCAVGEDLMFALEEWENKRVK